MNVPLKWLSDYVKLPKDRQELTDRLTAIGHMLDKTTSQGHDTVLDLELRGNRPDLLGLIGVAREISAAFHTPLHFPVTKPLPKKDPTCPLVSVNPDAVDLVTRYTAFTLQVKVGPSPKWLAEKLVAWGVPSINNVVDVTNFVMIETGQPLHAFDLNKLSGQKLILRKAKPNERFATIQQGLVLNLSPQDLVIGDSHQPQALTMIGGLHSKVTDHTTNILLESAVYHHGNCRRSSRRLKIFTDSSVRHEKILDPRQVEIALSRAYYLLTQLAQAKSTSLVSDYYPKPIRSPKINYQPSDCFRLSGLDIPISSQKKILSSLEFSVVSQHKSLQVTPPYFRTDITQSADIVEEVLRIHGYSHIPSQPFIDTQPPPATYTSYALQDLLRSHLLALGLNEVITLSFVPTTSNPHHLHIINPPDPDTATLRSSLTPNLVKYAQSLLDRNQAHVGVFEIGKVFSAHPQPQEKIAVAFAVAGQNQPSTWLTTPKPVSIYTITGILQTLEKLLGQAITTPTFTTHQHIFVCEFELVTPKVPTHFNPYQILSQYPPVVEDINISTIKPYSKIVQIITQVATTHHLTIFTTLIDKYQDKLTLRLSCHSPQRQLSHSDTSKLISQITDLVQE
jgi:phenylalanyl-tRNA synthetase beta chain